MGMGMGMGISFTNFYFLSHSRSTTKIFPGSVWIRDTDFNDFLLSYFIIVGVFFYSSSSSTIVLLLPLLLPIYYNLWINFGQLTLKINSKQKNILILTDFSVDPNWFDIRTSLYKTGGGNGGGNKWKKKKRKSMFINGNQ